MSHLIKVNKTKLMNIFLNRINNNKITSEFIYNLSKKYDIEPFVDVKTFYKDKYNDKYKDNMWSIHSDYYRNS